MAIDVKTGFAAINGAQIYYEVAGEGETVTLIHAGIADTRLWDPQFEVFAQRYRVIRCDQRGYGKTTAPAMAFSRVDDLSALLDQLGVERTALIGCSMGGTVALDYTLTHPEQVSALALIASDPSGYMPQGEPPPLIQKLIAARQQGDLEGMAQVALLLWGVGENRQPEQLDPHVRDLIHDMSLIGFRNQGNLGEERGIDPPAIGRLSDVHVPTLIIDGAEDHPTTHTAGEGMAQAIPNARRIVIEDAAHLPSLEKPEEFNEIVLGFLEDVL